MRRGQSSRAAEVPLRERATGAGFQVPLETRGAPSVAEFDTHENTPGPMMHGVSRRTFVVPSEPFLDVRRTTDVVTRRITFTAQDVDDSLTTAFHGQCLGMSRASENWREIVV